jgi:hypothetical protein
MTDRQMRSWADAGLIDALRRIEPEIDWPVAASSATDRDLAAAVRERIESISPPPARSVAAWRQWSLPLGGWARRPAQRALLIAVALLILLAAIAGAAGVGLPGLRVLFGGAPVSPPPSLEPSRSPSPGSPGAAMHLGSAVSLADPGALDALAGFHVRWPADPRAGRPDAGYIDETKLGQVSLVWSARTGLPATLEPGVGLLMTEFLGSVDEAFYGKVVGSSTTVEAVRVSGQRGYWLTGDPHFLFYSGPGGLVQDERRWVGDALIWSDGRITYRLESTLGRNATIQLAESLP